MRRRRAPTASAKRAQARGSGGAVGDGWFMAGTCRRRPAHRRRVDRAVVGSVPGVRRFRRVYPRRIAVALATKGRAMYVRNCWYVIAWDHEVPARRPLHAAPSSNEPILLFRTAAGEIVGLRDRCCHRLAPLSKGRKEGDCVRCGYHGLLFDATGRCIEIPGADTRAGEGARAALPDRAQEQVGVRLDGRPGARRPGPPARQLLVRLARLGLRARATSTTTRRSRWSATTCSTSRTSRYVHENTLGGSTAIARARPTIETGAARHPRHAPHPRRAVAAVLPRGARHRRATSTAGSSTTSSCPARC